MMTVRLYYDDPYSREFEARVVERTEVGQQPAVILDRTCFYPTSGGQPHDTGALNGVAVVDVMERPEDGAVLHVLSGELDGPAVRGRIDWARRFDHMQQHTGQHILSQACAQALGAETVSFHLGPSASTIDLARAPLTLAEVDEALALANDIVFDDRPVRTRFVTPEEVVQLPLRKRPTVSGPVRLVEVSGFDWSACGGTHCRATGEVGPIAVTKVERRGGQTRLEFLCGGRAVADYREKHRLLSALAGRFSVGWWELPEAVERLAGEAEAQRKALNEAHDRLLDHEAAQLVARAERRGEVRVVRALFAGREVESVRRLAMRVAEHEGCVALLGLAGAKAHLIFARAADLDLDVSALLKEACRIVGGGGGGRPHAAQGGGPRADKVEEALALAVERLTAAS